MEDGPGAGFWLKAVAAIFLFGIAGIIVFLLIGMAWYAWGGLGTFLLILLCLVLVSWIMDRRRAKRYEDLA